MTTFIDTNLHNMIIDTNCHFTCHLFVDHEDKQEATNAVSSNVPFLVERKIMARWRPPHVKPPFVDLQVWLLGSALRGNSLFCFLVIMLCSQDTFQRPFVIRTQTMDSLVELESKICIYLCAVISLKMLHSR